ncbi:MAG: hypothetical protein WDZ26_06865 [Nitriliruptoraceae bacterium]
MSSSSATTRSRVVALSATLLTLVGAALMAVAHAGVVLGLPGTPDTGRVVLPAAIGFGVATVVHTAIALGLLRRARWAPWVGTVVFGLTLVAAWFPFRGWVSAVAGVVSLAGLAATVHLATRRGPTPTRLDS